MIFLYVKICLKYLIYYNDLKLLNNFSTKLLEINFNISLFFKTSYFYQNNKNYIYLNQKVINCILKDFKI